MKNEITTTHNLDWEYARSPYGDWHYLFKVGTCEGQCGMAEDCYFILSIVNNKNGNGHLNDVFEWFEHSCKRDGKNLLILDFFNIGFLKHCIEKRGFIPLTMKSDGIKANHAIKVYNEKSYQKMMRKGNSFINPKKLIPFDLAQALREESNILPATLRRLSEIAASGSVNTLKTKQTTTKR